MGPVRDPALAPGPDLVAAADIHAALASDPAALAVAALFQDPADSADRAATAGAPAVAPAAPAAGSSPAPAAAAAPAETLARCYLLVLGLQQDRHLGTQHAGRRLHMLLPRMLTKLG